MRPVACSAVALKNVRAIRALSLCCCSVPFGSLLSANERQRTKNERTNDTEPTYKRTQNEEANERTTVSPLSVCVSGLNSTECVRECVSERVSEREERRSTLPHRLTS